MSNDAISALLIDGFTGVDTAGQDNEGLDNGQSSSSSSSSIFLTWP